MEKRYWLGRKHASLKLAQDAVGPEARLVHYELAGHYAVKAAFSEAVDLADSLPAPIHAKASSARRSSDA